MGVRWVALLVVMGMAFAGCLGGKEPKPVVVGCDEGLVRDEQGGCVFPTPVVEQVAAPPAPRWPHFPSDGASEYTTLEIPSFDDHQIPLSIFKPNVANATQQVPILLQSHGFTGSRLKDPERADIKAWVGAGFGVVSFDERGHGDAKDDSAVYFMHPDHEVQDVIKIIDYVATLDWVLLEAPGDPLLGAVGGSYGGAYQIMGAIFDGRLDAIVPEITWNDITEGLAPNGAIKSGWIDIFYVGGTAQQSVVFADDFNAGFAWVTTTNTLPRGQAPGVPDLYTRFKEASPVSYPGRLTIPTLLIQGMPDTLFPLNQAVANLRLLEDAGVASNESALYTHNKGHILQVNSLRSGTTPVPVGLQGLPGGEPCGALNDLQIAWHQKHLLGLNVSTGPRVCLALEDESNVVGETFPLEGTVMQRFDLGGPTPVLQAAAGPSLSISLFTAEQDTVIAGLPRLNGTLLTTGSDAIVFFSLEVPSRGDAFDSVVDDQFTPLRMSAQVAAKPFSIDLGGIGVRLKAGEELVLVASTVEPVFFASAQRVPGGVILDKLVLELPVVPADAPSLALPAK